MAKISDYISVRRLQLFWNTVKSQIPTKLSQLNNDANYVVDASYVHTDNNYTNTEKSKLRDIEAQANKYTLPPATAALLGGVKIGANITVAADGTISVEALSWANIDGKPTKLSEFANDEGFITKSVSDLSNYYTKSQTYTKTEVTALIGDVKTISIQKVTTLPATGASNIIYLVPANPAANDNNYIEYIWVAGDNKFEAIGDTKIDLSGYWSKTELVEATEAEINAIFS